jgi:hypothetical protein
MKNVSQITLCNPKLLAKKKTSQVVAL